MNNSTLPNVNPTSEPPPARFGSLARLARVLLCLVICLVTLFALFTAVENWRGKRAWSAYQKEMEAKGVALDLQRLVPPAVPDDQNFAMTPILAPFFDFLPGTQTYRDTNALVPLGKAFDLLPTEPRSAGDWRKGEKTDLAGWLAAYKEPAPGTAGRRGADTNPPPALDRPQAAAALLERLKANDPILDELRKASQRPHARFNIHYSEPNPAGILLPHLAKVKALVRTLSLRASAELALGQTEPALNDINLACYLTDTIRSEPILISHLVRCANVHLALQPVWEGLVEQRWSDAQLQALDQSLRKFDFLTDNLSAMAGERAFGNAIIAYVRLNPRMLPHLGDIASESDQSVFNLCSWLVPNGWFYLEGMNYDRLFEERMLPGITPASRRVDARVITQNGEALATDMRAGWTLVASHRVLASMLLPALVQAHRKFAYVQTAIDEARVACALERARLATGQWPESPAALAPRFLDSVPHDLLNGEPLKFRRTAGGGFLLYSVGWNLKDDGGEIGRTARGKGKGREGLDPMEGDWVWPGH
jgi:hypothetical protein